MKRLIKLVAINARFVHSCLALFYIRNEIEKKCESFQIDIFQLTINDNYYEILLLLTEENPEYIFFSAAIWNTILVERLIGDIISCLPDCQIVIGGPQAEVLADSIGFISACTIVSGDIEAVGGDFFIDLEKGDLAEHYGGSFLKKKNIHYGYPYRDSDFDSYLANKNIYYESSRGCPFSCTYCLSAAEHGVYHKEMVDVEKELLDILSHRPKVVRFVDRTFNDRPDRALAIWKFLAAHGGGTRFHFEIAPNYFNEEIFAFLATVAPGRFQFELGIQSTHPDTLTGINRLIDPAKAHMIISRLAAMNTIHLHVDLILGLPHETEESFADSFRDVFAMAPHYIQMGLLKMLPGAPICKKSGELGYIYCRQPPYSVLATSWLDHSSLSGLYWFCECVEKFVNNRYFVSFWAYLRKIDSDIFLLFKRLLVICRESGFFQLAATQELMCKKLVELVADSEDKDLIIEILRFDWLRCGFRFLPDVLQLAVEDSSPAQIRSALYSRLPASYKDVFNSSDRNYFFRKSFFLYFSKQAIVELGFVAEGEKTCLCFLQEKETGLFSFNRVVVLPTVST